MMKKVSLQTKILVLIISLIILITFLLTAIYAYFEAKDIEEHFGERALHVASTVSLMPTVQQAFLLEEPEKVIQPIAQEVKDFTGAEFIVVGNTDSIRYAHPDPEKIGKKMVGDDNERALIYGEYYISTAVGSLGPSLRGKAPILNENGEIIGIVSVGFMINDIKTLIFQRLLKISGGPIFVLIIGIIGGILLTRNIRKDTMGLEPYEIASLYRDRNAILTSIHEGIIAVDNNKSITMLNESVQTMLGISMDAINKSLDDVFPNSRIFQGDPKNNEIKNEEMILNNRHVIVNRTPIVENGKVVGGVLSIRDKTEINEMINALSEVRKYSEDLRAQTHEYTNKLYALSGLLQLGEYEEAIDLIEKESKITSSQNKILIEQIKDRAVQAILLGKLGRASEHKIHLEIDPNSSLEKLPEIIDIAKLITILGNLIDNAMEAVEKQTNKYVSFFATDLGEDIIFEVADNGIGISDDMVEQIFTKGYSTKDKENRGYGLAIVKEAVRELNGQIEVNKQSSGGTVFTVFIPKKM
ncbi:ATP-binding protein [Anaerobacillus sp. MEB173]|uniref:ATP-binding protein n=1 Tax=Anaerobacillus sp. MEB173 TaxID=3383345 RepID=UPI003F8ED82E